MKFFALAALLSATAEAVKVGCPECFKAWEKGIKADIATGWNLPGSVITRSYATSDNKLEGRGIITTVVNKGKKYNSIEEEWENGTRAWKVKRYLTKKNRSGYYMMNKLFMDVVGDGTEVNVHYGITEKDQAECKECGLERQITNSVDHIACKECGIKPPVCKDCEGGNGAATKPFCKECSLMKEQATAEPECKECSLMKEQSTAEPFCKECSLMKEQSEH